jgi:hypothetical protein
VKNQKKKTKGEKPDKAQSKAGRENNDTTIDV